MNRVMGGNLPARLWREVMLLAHEGVPPRALPGTLPTSGPIAPSSSAVELSSAGQTQTARAEGEPDPIARVIAEDAGYKASATKVPTRTWTGATMDSLRRGLGFGG